MLTWEKRKLGRTGFEVTVLGIGGAWLGNQAGHYNEEQGIETVLTALESGINLVDTSDNYINGRSEEIVGRALTQWWNQGNRRDDLILSSKVSISEINPEAFSYDGTMRGIECSLQKLRTDYLDIYLAHDPTDISLVLDDEGCLRALRKLKEQRVIRAIGLGCRSHQFHRECIQTGEFDVSLTFGDYNLVDTSAFAGVLESATKQKVGVFNASINRGLTTAKNTERTRELKNWCQRSGVDISALNLHFCIRQRLFASTLIGFSRPERVEQNLEAYKNPFDEGVWRNLESAMSWDLTTTLS